MLLLFLLTLQNARADEACHSYRTGNDQALRLPTVHGSPFPERVDFVRPTRDRRGVLLRSRNSVGVMDLVTGARTTFEYPNVGIEDARLSEDRQTVQFVLSDGRLITRRVPNGPEHTERLAVMSRPDDRVVGATISPDGRTLAYNTMAGPSVVALDPPVHERPVPETIGRPTFTDDSSRYAYIDRSNQVVVKSSTDNSTRATKIEGEAQPYSASFSPDGQRMIYLSQIPFTDRHFVTVTNSNSHFTLPSDQPVRDAKISPDGKRLLVRTETEITIYDLWTRKPIRKYTAPNSPYCTTDHCAENITSAEFTANSEHLRISVFHGRSQSLHIASGLVEPMPAGVRSFNDVLSGPGAGSANLLYAGAEAAWYNSTESRCSGESVQVCNCRPPGYRPNSEYMKDFNVHQQCGRAFDKDAWDAITPVPSTNPMPHNEAMRYLRRFQKPGGFEPARHLGILLALLRSDLPVREPELAAGAMQAVLGVSNALYRQLLDEVPGLVAAIKKASTDPKKKPACRTPEEETRVRASTLEFLNYLRNRHDRPLAESYGPSANVPYIEALGPVVMRMTPEERALEPTLTDGVENRVCVIEARCQWSKTYKGLAPRPWP